MDIKSTPLWQPSQQQVDEAEISKFSQYLEQRFCQIFVDYAALHHWSIENRADFWQAWWDYCEIIHQAPCEDVLQDGVELSDSKWFVGATLNFAENCLRYRDKQQALLEVREDGSTTTITYHELFDKVAALASCLRQQGVKPGDRVAAVLPNCSEAIIAFLATSSIGAVWSSCSPDFGVEALLDRFSQIEPKVLLLTNGYSFKGRAVDTTGLYHSLSEQLPSLTAVITVEYLARLSFPCKPPAELTSLCFADCLVTEDVELEFHYDVFEHPLAILFSSGTTGKPKCIVHGVGGTLLQHLKEHRLHTDLKRKDKLFFFTTCGWMMWNWLVTGLASGATLVLYDGSPVYPSPRRLFEISDEQKVSVFGCSAKLISAVENSKADFGDLPLKNLRAILTTGSPLLPENFDYVYREIKSSLCLSSISGGTDIVSCFALGNPALPVYSGQLQCLGLGMAVAFFDSDGKPLRGQKGELVCTKSFPSMPVGFWNDPDGSKYHKAYFAKFPGIWAHGDYGELTPQGGVIIYGRSDAVLNPGGVRIGTAEIYRQVEKHPDVAESMAVAYHRDQDEEVVLFVVLTDETVLNQEITAAIKQQIREGATPRHVPQHVFQVVDLPRTRSGKLSELAVRDVINGLAVENVGALANPECLQQFSAIAEKLK